MKRRDTNKTIGTGRLTPLIGGVAAAVIAFGCGPEVGEGGESEPVEHDEVQQSVLDTSQEAADAIIEGIALLESSELAGAAFGENCTYTSDGFDGQDSDDEVTQDYQRECEPAGPDADQMQAEYEEFAEILEQYVFTEQNVESEQGGSVTYLLDGETVCETGGAGEPVTEPAPQQDTEAENQQDPDFDDAEPAPSPDPTVDDSCVQEVDELELRLRASKVGGTLEIDVLVGPDEVEPVSFGLSSNEISVTVTLDEIERASDHIAEVAGEQPGEFPDQFSGQIQFSLSIDDPTVGFAIELLQDLNIGSDDFSFYASAAGDGFSIEADTLEETIELMQDWGAVEIDAMIPGGEMGSGEPIVYNDDDGSSDDGAQQDFGEQEDVDPVDFGFEMAGASATAIFDVNTDEVQWQDVGLGGGPTIVSVDGQNIIEIDLNAGLGGVFDAVASMEDDAMKLEFDPGIEVEAALMFDRLAEEYREGIDEWALNEVLTFEIGGDANPAVLLQDYGLEVLRGHVKFESSSGASVAAHEGECLWEEPQTSDIQEDDGNTGSAGDYHPFDELEAGQCEM